MIGRTVRKEFSPYLSEKFRKIPQGDENVKSNYWKRKIKEQMQEVGTYAESFEPIILTLADILAERDAVYSKYVKEGSQAMIVKTSDRGARNAAKNPLLVLWEELNRDALSYWKELGLTAASLKRINENAIKSEKRSSALEEALMRLG